MARHKNGNGHRLAFLIVEVEPPDALSTRKLLLEGAKYNVLTAYSGKEGLAMFTRFPAVDAVAIDAELRDIDSSELAQRMRTLDPQIRIVAISPRMAAKCKWADHTVNSHEPRELLQLLEKLGGRASL